MQIGDRIHLDGLKAEYSLFGRDRFSACTLPDGDYVIVALEDNHVKFVGPTLAASRRESIATG